MAEGDINKWKLMVIEVVGGDAKNGGEVWIWEKKIKLMKIMNFFLV